MAATTGLQSTVSELTETVGNVQQIANTNKDAIAGNTDSIQETNGQSIKNMLEIISNQCFVSGKIDDLLDEVNELVNTEIEGIKKEMAIVTDEIMPPIGTVMGWFSKLDLDGDALVDLPPSKK